MDTATDIFIYAWIGWLVIMLPTLVVLAATSWAIGKISNRIYRRLLSIYRADCLQYYFRKMEKEGTHAAFRKSEGDL